MSNEHTPGPWEVTDSRHVSTGKTLYLFENKSAKAGELRANARLLAAAPELLAALKGLVVAASAPSSPHVAGHGIDQSATHEGLTNCDALAAARAAIDKAVGKGGAP